MLYVGSDARLLRTLRGALASERYEVEQTCDPHAALQRLRDGSYALAVVDHAPRGSNHALQLARDVRQRLPWVGILLCVAVSDSTSSWNGLSGLCDDYLVKPYRLRELMLRVRSAASRSHWAPRAAGLANWGPFTIDFVRQSVYVHGQETSLQPLQVRLLGYLVQHAERSVPHDELRAQVFRVAQRPRSTSLARQVSVLRRVLGSAGAFIRTVPGGYRIAADPLDL